MRKLNTFVLGCITLFIPLKASLAENWPQWRGPMFNGSTTETGLPDRLDPKADLVWKTAMPGFGASTPIIWEDRLFITSVDKQSMKLLAMCLDNKTGKPIWQREVGEGTGLNGRGNNTASPSPVTDGKTVFFYFASGELAAFDMQGKPLWERNLVKEYGPFYIKWIYSSSPLLQFGKLFVQVIHRDVPPNGPAVRGAAPAESYLLAIDPATGKNIYRHVRATNAQAESKESYATPVAYEGAGRKEIVLIGGDCITGHDADTGAELWRSGGWNQRKAQNFRVVATPVVFGKNLLICTPNPTGNIICLNADGSGDITSKKTWEVTQTKSDVPSPLVYQDDLFVLDGDFRKGLSRMNPATGEVKWFTPIASGALLRASPMGADGKIFVMNEEAEVWVLSAADGKILSNTQLETEGGARGSIVASRGRLFVRTGSTLYCFGEKSK